MEDPFERLATRIEIQMSQFEKRVDEATGKIDAKLEQGPPLPPLPGDNGGSPKAPPRPPGPPVPEPPYEALDDVSERLSDAGDKILTPARDINAQVNNEIDRAIVAGKKFQKGAQKAMFPIQAVTSPVSLVIFLKNAREHPEMDTDQLIEETTQETIGWALDVANIAWPGTAAPDAKEQVKERIGGYIESYTGLNLFEDM